MPQCHQCSGDLDGNARNGNCKVCYTKGVDLCQRCAMWELGPLEADVKLAKALRKTKKEALVQRQDRDKSEDSLAKLGEEPLACDVFLPTLGTACPFFKDQLKNKDATLYGEPFCDYVCKVMDKFQDLYKTCKYDRVALQVLIAMHLSSQERVQCRQIKDAEGSSKSDAARPVKRWETREIAVAHLKAHLDDIETAFGKTVRDAVERPAWLVALGTDGLELYLKELKHPTLTALDLLAAAGSADAAREALEVWVIVYHALTATRSKGEVEAHWVSKILPANFAPKEALGFLSAEHYKRMYGGAGGPFEKAAQDDIEKLWNVLGDNDAKNALPSHPRYADISVSGNGLLDAVEKSYLQYLPGLDHPESQKDQRTPCEKVVRARVIATLKKYLANYGKKFWRREPTLKLTWRKKDALKGTTKTLTIEDKRGGSSQVITFKRDIVNATKKLADTEKALIAPFLRGLFNGADLRAHGFELEIEIEGEEGNERRSARKTAVEAAVKEAFDAEKTPFAWRPTLTADDGALKNDAPLDTFLDDLCARMKADYYVDQAFDCNVSELIVKAALADRAFVPKAWFPLKLVDVDYTALFPDCDFSGAQLTTIDEHYTEFTGTSARPSHYMDWRNHKDLWLYDCFPIVKRRRPLFASLSMQPLLPAPNSNYGGHILYYKRPPLAGRCVFTFGDKQQPRRSMLLLLDTILHGRKKKDGFDAQAPGERQKVVYDLLRRYDSIELSAGKTAEELWDETSKTGKVNYPKGDLSIECHIFGAIDLTTDAWAFCPAVEDKDSVYYVKKDHLKLTDFNDAQLKLKTVYPLMTLLPYEPHSAGKPVTSGESAWTSDLSEIVE